MKKIVLMFLLLSLSTAATGAPRRVFSLWQMYESTLSNCKYVDLTHTFSPSIPVWPGYSRAQFQAARARADIPGFVKQGEAFTYAAHGFQSTAYVLPTEQYGTHIDPPAHFNEFGATISDLPATYAVRPLVVIDIHAKVQRDSGYHCTVADIKAWEKRHGRIPEGSVVMIRSDWYKRWNEIDRFPEVPFPGIMLDALKFLHLERRILMHGHEGLDTDTTTEMVGETWLLHNDFSQIEGVANLDKVPEAGALVSIGFNKPEGGTGALSRFVAICPADWPYGQSVRENPGAPLPKQAYPLRRDADGVLRPARR